MFVKMAAVCPCSDSNHYRQTVLMALIAALKAVFSGARRGLVRVICRFPCAHAFLTRASAPMRMRIRE